MRQRPIRILPTGLLLWRSFNFRNILNTTLAKRRDPKISR